MHDSIVGRGAVTSDTIFFLKQNLTYSFHGSTICTLQNKTQINLSNNGCCKNLLVLESKLVYMNLNGQNYSELDTHVLFLTTFLGY